MSAARNSSPSFPERTEYEILSETETDTEITGVIRNTYSGVQVTCHIPRHTPEEEAKLSADITYALMQTVYTGRDISGIRSMEILKD